MKTISRFIALVLCFGILISCAQQADEPTSSAEMINLEDEIDDMVFTVEDEYDFSIVVHSYCGFDPTEKTDTTAYYECFALPGVTVSFGNCIATGAKTIEELDDDWNKFNKPEITFDGKAINLPQFGLEDFTSWNGMEARGWNVIVENIAQGTHTIQCRYEYDGVFYEESFFITVPDEKEVFPVLSEQVTPRIQFYTSEKANLNYLMYVPGEYGVNTDREWPLLLYLHGVGNVNSSVRFLENEPPFSSLGYQDYFPFIVVAPQGHGEYEFWATDEMIDSIMTLLNEIQSVLSVNANQVFLTGVSAGGNGAWEIGLRHPERFAALAPVMGYYYPFGTVPQNICDLKEVPVWAFHGAKDEVVPLEAEQQLVDSLQECGGDVQFTVYPDAGHDIEALVYKNSDMFSWLLSQPIG